MKAKVYEFIGDDGEKKGHMYYPLWKLVILWILWEMKNHAKTIITIL